MTNTQKGVIYAFIAAIISGIAIFYAKVSVTKIDPLILTTSRNFFAGLILLVPYLFSINYKKEITSSQSNRAPRNDNKILMISKLLLISLIGGSIPFFLFFNGLKLVGPQTANFIQKSLFIWVGIASILILKEKTNIFYWLAFILIFLANFLISPQKLSLDQGVVLIFMATILWSAENIIVKKMINDISESTLAIFRMLVGSAILFLITFSLGKASLFLSLNSSQILMIAVGGTILSFYVYFWYKALKYISASLVTLILTFSLVVGNILNGMFAGITISQKEIITSSCITLAVVMVILMQIKHKYKLLKTK